MNVWLENMQNSGNLQYDIIVSYGKITSILPTVTGILQQYV